MPFDIQHAVEKVDQTCAAGHAFNWHRRPSVHGAWVPALYCVRGPGENAARRRSLTYAATRRRRC